MPKRIILAAKDKTEYDLFKKKLKNKEIFKAKEFSRWKEENLNVNKDGVYLLAHFGSTDSEFEICESMKSWQMSINSEKVHIIPISVGSGSTHASELYEKVTKNDIPENLDEYRKYWEKRCRDFSKNNIMNSVLPFCIHCKNASLWPSNEKDFDKNFKERKEHIKDSLVIARKILLSGKPVWENSDFKDKLGTISGLVEPKNNDYELKESETKAFIKEMVDAESKKTPGFIKLLENLKEWVDTDNVQK